MSLRCRVSLLLTLAALLSAACGTRPVMPPLPSRGGPAWLELKNDHFVMWTNVASEKAHELLSSLEERRQVVARAMNRAEQPRRIFAIVLRNWGEFQFFLPRNTLAFAWPKMNPTYQPGIALSADMWSFPVVVNHELAHAISFSLIAQQPVWLAEGLACYFEMGRVDPKTHQIVIGLPEAGRIQTLRKSGPLAVKDLFACERGRSCDNDRFYASSWALFAYLIDKHLDRLGIYLGLLGKLEGNHERAWLAAFPTLSPEKLDDDLWDWIQEGSVKLSRITVEQRLFPAVERRLGDADVLAARSLLFLVTGQHEAARREAAAATAADRAHPLAWAMARSYQAKFSLADARAMTAAHPTDWRAWQHLLASLYKEFGDPTEGKPETPEQREVRERMCALAAEDKVPCYRWRGRRDRPPRSHGGSGG
jgi:hypothetical protein